MKLFSEGSFLTAQKEWHSHDVSVNTNRGIVMLHASDALFWKKNLRRERKKSRWDIQCDNWQVTTKDFSFSWPSENMWWETIRFWKRKANGFFAHQSSAAKDDFCTEKQSLSFVMDLFQLLLFFLCVFYFYFSPSGNFHEAWTHRRTTIITAVSGKLPIKMRKK